MVANDIITLSLLWLFQFFLAMYRWKNASELYSLGEDGYLSKGQYRDMYYRLSHTFNFILESEWNMPPENPENFEKNCEHDWQHDKGLSFS